MDNWTLFITIAVVITAAGFVQSAMGFGYAIVALAILPLVIDIRMANIVVSLSVILPLGAAVWAYRHEIDWPTIAWCLTGSVVGLAFGLIVFSTIDATWLMRATGGVIFLLALDGLRTRRDTETQRQFSHGWSAVAGAAGGVLSGSIGMGGPPIVAFAARQTWSPVRVKAFLTSVALILSVLKGVGLAATGWVDQAVLFYSGASIPFGLAGSHLGVVASRNMNPQLFRKITMLVLLLLSIGMIVRGQPNGPGIDKAQNTHGKSRSWCAIESSDDAKHKEHPKMTESVRRASYHQSDWQRLEPDSDEQPSQVLMPLGHSPREPCGKRPLSRNLGASNARRGNLAGTRAGCRRGSRCDRVLPIG